MIKHKVNDILNFSTWAAILAFLIFGSYFVYEKFDLTEEKRFTLTDETLELASGLDDVIEFKIYIEGEHLPADITRLKNSIHETLIELSDYSDGDVEFEFINLEEEIEDIKEREQEKYRMAQQGLRLHPIITVDANGKPETIPLLLGGKVHYNGNDVLIPFGRRTNDNRPLDIEAAISSIEYEIANAIKKLKQPALKRVAFLQGHGELGSQDVREISKALFEFYQVGPAYLKDSVGNEQLNALDGIDLLIVAKPQIAFTQKEQFILDQFIMNGGKTLWLVEGVKGAEMDSLFVNGITMPLHLTIGIENLLYSYGVKLNHDIVEDLQCSKLPLQAESSGDRGGYTMKDWIYKPILKGSDEHIINSNLDPLLFEFSSSLGIVDNDGVIHKELIKSSGANRYKKAMSRIAFDEAMNGLKPELFKSEARPLALLVEGNFNSYFKNRITPSFASNPKSNYRKQSEANKMVVIGDGDFIKNKYSPKGMPLPIGIDLYTKKQYDNEKFLLNTINYLLNDAELISIRSKNIEMRLLDNKKIEEQKTSIQIANMSIPTGVILLISLLFFFIRRYKYAK